MSASASRISTPYPTEGPVRYTIDFGGDMSAARRTPKMYTFGKRHAFVVLSWPATGTPVGLFAVEESNVASDATVGTPHAVAIDASKQPSGVAGSLALSIDTSADYLAFSYTPTSGGTGANITGKDGNLSIVVIKD